MKFLVILCKELLESLSRSVKKLYSSVDDPYVEGLVESITADGLHVIDDFYTPEQCDLLIKKIDELVAADGINIWRDATGSDNRIYFANDIDPMMDSFYRHPFIRKALFAYTGIREPVGMVLAARIDYKPENIGSGGGWHRDSPVTHQFKALLYLSDVSSGNGPFQYIKKSHGKLRVIKAYMKKIFKAGQYRFTNAQVEQYLDYTRSSITTLEGRQGTLALVDTKGIHQGAPLKTGSRYALFCYFWDEKVPDHFLSLRQKQSSRVA